MRLWNRELSWAHTGSPLTKEGGTADAKDEGGLEREDPQAPWAQEKLAEGTRAGVLLFLKEKEEFSAESGEAWRGDSQRIAEQGLQTVTGFKHPSLAESTGSHLCLSSYCHCCCLVITLFFCILSDLLS